MFIFSFVDVISSSVTLLIEAEDEKSALITLFEKVKRPSEFRLTHTENAEDQMDDSTADEDHHEYHHDMDY